MDSASCEAGCPSHEDATPPPSEPRNGVVEEETDRQDGETERSEANGLFDYRQRPQVLGADRQIQERRHEMSRSIPDEQRP